MRIYDEIKINNLYETNKKRASDKLKEIEVFCGNEPNLLGLNGWVYEQTIQYCIKKELIRKNIKAQISEQVTLKSRSKVDLKINNIAIEIKTSGLYHIKDIDKYNKYMKIAKSKGLKYLYLSGSESYKKYKEGMIAALGKECSFFLDEQREWDRFMNTIESLLASS